MRFYQTAESMQQKTDFEIVKELNDLRESILALKDERDKITRHLADNGLESKRQFSDMTNETLFSHIQKLTVDKNSMGEELREREESISVLRQQVSTLEIREKVASEERIRLKEEVKRLTEECERLRRRADDKEREASKCLEMLNHRENEFAADLQEKELLFKAASSERDRLITTLSEMQKAMSKAEQDGNEALGLLADTNKILREKFATALSEVKGIDFRKSDDSFMEVIYKLIDRTNMISQKEAKILATEEKVKIGNSKISQLKKENKTLKQMEDESVLKQILSVVQTQKPSKKSSVSMANDTLITKLLDEAVTGKKTKRTFEMDVLQTELSASNISLKKKEAENALLLERMTILEVEAEKAKEEARLSDKEVKRLSKETKKTTKMFNEEIASLIGKLGPKQDDRIDDRAKEMELASHLKEKKE